MLGTCTGYDEPVATTRAPAMPLAEDRSSVARFTHANAPDAASPPRVTRTAAIAVTPRRRRLTCSVSAGTGPRLSSRLGRPRTAKKPPGRTGGLINPASELEPTERGRSALPRPFVPGPHRTRPSGLRSGTDS